MLVVWFSVSENNLSLFFGFRKMDRVYRTFAVLFEVGDEVVVATDLMVCSCPSMVVEPRLSLGVTLKKGYRVFTVDLH